MVCFRIELDLPSVASFEVQKSLTPEIRFKSNAEHEDHFIIFERKPKKKSSLKLQLILKTKRAQKFIDADI